MSIDAVEEADRIASYFDMKTEKIAPWNGRSVQVTKSYTENLASILEKQITSLRAKEVVKPLMGTLRDGKARVEGGYNERDGAYVKGVMEWTFGESDTTESQNESNGTSKGPGEVNSTDRDQDRD